MVKQKRKHRDQERIKQLPKVVQQIYAPFDERLANSVDSTPFLLLYFFFFGWWIIHILVHRWLLFIILWIVKIDAAIHRTNNSTNYYGQQIRCQTKCERKREPTNIVTEDKSTHEKRRTKKKKLFRIKLLLWSNLMNEWKWMNERMNGGAGKMANRITIITPTKCDACVCVRVMVLNTIRE